MSQSVWHQQHFILKFSLFFVFIKLFHRSLVLVSMSNINCKSLNTVMPAELLNDHLHRSLPKAMSCTLWLSLQMEGQGQRWTMEVPDFYGAATCVACPPFCPSLSTGKQGKETASTPVAWCQHQARITTPVQEDVLWVSVHQAPPHTAGGASPCCGKAGGWSVGVSAELFHTPHLDDAV